MADQRQVDEAFEQLLGGRVWVASPLEIMRQVAIDPGPTEALAQRLQQAIQASLPMTTGDIGLGLAVCSLHAMRVLDEKPLDPDSSARLVNSIVRLLQEECGNAHRAVAVLNQAVMQISLEAKGQISASAREGGGL